MTLARKKLAVVRVRRITGHGEPLPTPPDADAPVFAEIGPRNRPAVRQWMAPDARRALGSDELAYFEAERIGNIWFLGERVPHDLGW